MTQTVLILGASGRFGHNAAEQFTNAGWTVRRFDRARDDLNIAAKGADVIVNGWNPDYPDWQTRVPDLTARVIAAAKSSGATVIIPGNVYVFGEATPAPWSQTTPHNAANPLGRVRIEMEAAYRASGVRCILLRAGDFIDTRASGNWLDLVMLKTLGKGVFTYPGTPDIDHTWAFLPDLCRAAVELAGIRAQLPEFADIPFPGFTISGAEVAAQISTLTGAKVRVKQMSWLPLQLARPFWRMGACLLEMRYLWDTAHQLDGTLFASLLPEFRATSLSDALARALPEDSVQRQINPNQTVTAGG